MYARTSHHNAVRKLLREQCEKVKLTRAWEELLRQFECGEVRGGFVYFTAAERQSLRRQCRQVWGFDPIEAAFSGDRHAAAAGGAVDEKIASQRPDDGFVLVKGMLPAPLPQLADGLSLRVPVAQLDLAAIRQVLVVENLDSFDAIERYPLPPALAGSLLLYRGHGGLARGTRQLLAALPPTCAVCVFADFDPAGLLIALTLPAADSLLLPELDSDLLAAGSTAHFQRQHRQVSALQGTLPAGWQAVWAQMQAAGVSIKQQQMLAAGCALRPVPRQP